MTPLHAFPLLWALPRQANNGQWDTVSGKGKDEAEGAAWNGVAWEQGREAPPRCPRLTGNHFRSPFPPLSRLRFIWLIDTLPPVSNN